MKLMSRFCIALVVGGLVALQAAAKIDLKRVTPVPENKPVPIEDYFRPPLLSQPQMNPAGTRIASIITAAQDKQQLLIYEIDSQKTDNVSAWGDKDIVSVDWLNDDRVIFVVSSQKLFGLGLLAGEFGKLKRSYPLIQYYGTRVVAIPSSDRMHPVLWNKFDFDTGRDRGAEIIETEDYGVAMLDLFKADITSEEIRTVRDNSERRIKKSYPKPGPGVTYGYMADAEGRLEFAFVSDNANRSLMQFDGKGWVRCPVDLEKIDVVTYGEVRGQIVVFEHSKDRKPGILRYMDAASGTPGDVILQDESYDFKGFLVRHPLSGGILGAKFDRDFPKTIWFDAKRRELQAALEPMFPGVIVNIVDSNDAETRFLFTTYSDRQPVIYNWVDMKKGAAGLFKSSRPWIDPKRMRPMSVFKFKTRDGRRLDAYLTLPEGASVENPAPLIVLSHGGPWARDSWGFNGEVQFLASKGYAVLQPNYRASTGYDWMFSEAELWDFMKMHEDVTDATRAIISKGMVDPDRVAIMGASFGGYLALAGVVNEPELYRCAVTNAGVFDWADQVMSYKEDRFDTPFYAGLIRYLGDPKKESEKYHRISPGRHTDKIRVPVFVAAGKADFTVDYTQSTRLIAELEKNKVPHEKLIVREEGHGMGHIENEVELYRRIERFLATNMAPRKAP
ncbi:MAG TPA: alpha/beta fold hydrolase [Opitutaceae bacterium]|nr:alpha/beta fold hydrolase [Opitutaceae bacterium]